MSCRSNVYAPGASICPHRQIPEKRAVTRGHAASLFFNAKIASVLVHINLAIEWSNYFGRSQQKISRITRLSDKVFPVTMPTFLIRFRIIVCLFFTISLFCFPSFAAVDSASKAKRPNIVFILADDLGYMDIGANNPKTFYETPNIDSLAKRGMRFTQGYAACPVCSPTRASIMTGKYPPRTGVTDYIPGMRNAKLRSAPNADHLPLEEVTIAERLRDAGYAIFFAGKWHLGKGEFSPGAQGFDEKLMSPNGQFFYPQSDVPPPDVKDDPKTSDRIADEAVRFIESHKNKPFFAYLPFPAVHVPIRAREDLIVKYEKKQASAPKDKWGQERNSKVRLVQNHAAYAAMLEQMDTAIGRVLGALQRSGLADSTIVVFTSDNGGLSTAESSPTSNLPLRAGKGWLYEGGIRVAWIVSARSNEARQRLQNAGDFN